MKHTILSGLLFISLGTTGQIKKESILLGGDLNFSSGSFKSDNVPNSYPSNNSGFGISPVAGFAVKENLIVGIGLSYGTNIQKQEQPNSLRKLTSNSYGGNIFIRKYYLLSSSFFLFVNSSLGVNEWKQKSTYDAPANNTEQKTLSVAGNIFPGIAFKIKKNFFLEASLNNLLSISYSQNNATQTDVAGNQYGTTGKQFSFSSSIGNGSNPLSIGAKWIIAKK